MCLLKSFGLLFMRSGESLKTSILDWRYGLLPVATSFKLEFELAGGRLSMFAKVVYQQCDETTDQGICERGIGVTFYGLDPADQFSIGELVEAKASKYIP